MTNRGVSEPAIWPEYAWDMRYPVESSSFPLSLCNKALQRSLTILRSLHNLIGHRLQRYGRTIQCVRLRRRVISRVDTLVSLSGPQEQAYYNKLFDVVDKEKVCRNACRKLAVC